MKKISILLTSNEEGDAKDGTIEKVLDELNRITMQSIIV